MIEILYFILSIMMFSTFAYTIQFVVCVLFSTKSFKEKTNDLASLILLLVAQFFMISTFLEQFSKII